VKSASRKKDQFRSNLPLRSGGASAVIIERGDSLIVLSALLLTAIGLVMVYSASPFVAMKYHRADWYFFTRQLLFTVIGLGALFVGAKVDVDIYRRWIKIVLLVFIILMGLQLVSPLGPRIGGTRRWLDLGFVRIQTSDVARSLIIIYLARILSEKPEVLQKLNKRMLSVIGIIAVPILLTIFQPDLSSALVMTVIAGLILFLGGMKLRHIFAFGSVGGLFGSIWILKTSYQRERLINFFLRITEGSGGDNYQTMQSLLGFGRGGLFGVGLGQGKQKMLFLPEPHTDFIYSIIGEELGLIRAALVLVLFLILALRTTRMLKDQPDRFNYLLGSGLICSIVVFALINMYVATGLMPVTGLPLPFISSGGTNLVISLWSVGVLWQLSGKAVRSGR